jgi:hypothetical protein
LLGRQRLDRALSDILDRCLAVDPRRRFSTVQEIVDALRRRRETRARRPMLLLGGLGPVLLLAVMIVFGVRGYRRAKQESADAIRRRAFESNKFAAAFIARSFEAEVRRYFDVVAEEASRPDFQAALDTVLAMPARERLGQAGPGREDETTAALVESFIADPERRALDGYFRARLEARLGDARHDQRAPRFVSIFAVDAEGTHLGAAYSDPETQTRSVGRYYAWRSYFHGGPGDLPRETPRGQVTPLARPHLSAPYRSTTTNGWRVGVATPLQRSRGGTPSFAGVLVFSVDLGDFDLLAVDGQPARDRFAALVDVREGEGGGRIVLHPYFADLAGGEGAGPPERARPLVDRQLLGRLSEEWRLSYRDPLGDEPGGAAYRGPWIAAAQPLHLPGPAGLVVLVQERSDAATAPVEALGSKLLREGALALLAVGLAMAGLWLLALRARTGRAERAPASETATTVGPRALRDRSTLSEADHV